MATEYISTETGCQYLRKHKIEDGTSFLYDEGFNDGIETAISCIGNEIPAADVRPVAKGKWLPYEFGDYHWHKCSVCGVADKYIETVYRKGFIDNEIFSVRNFCPNCGADMRGDHGNGNKT
jgi:hypothetical protein